MRKIKDRPELTELLRKSVEAVKKMSPKQLERMIRKQRQSWSRQDRD